MRWSLVVRLAGCPTRPRDLPLRGPRLLV